MDHSQQHVKDETHLDPTPGDLTSHVSSGSHKTAVDDKRQMETPSSQGHGVALDQHLDPMKWPLTRKLYVSSVASLFTFALLFNVSAISAGLPQISAEFNISMTEAIITFSLFIFGIAFAPLVTPHISERIGRTPMYFIGTFLSSMFLIGASRSQNIAALAACRFFAGFMQGPVVVLLEGTYADVWPAMYTGTYYIFIAASQYLGAATGAVLGGTLVHVESWRWTQYVGLMFNLLALVYGVGIPETYPRQIARRAARQAGRSANLDEAASGETLGKMVKLTVVDPVIMIFTDPLVILVHLYLLLNFGVLFQFFVLVPAVLGMLANFNAQQSGFAFIAAYGGTALAFVTAIVLDQITARRSAKRNMNIEHRMIPAMWGSVLMVASLFWIGWTSRPGYHYTIPIIGTAFYVWGSASSLSAFVGYLFDAYPPPATLSALTACAVGRVLAAGWFALFVLTAASNITGPWLLSAFGFSAAAMLPVPFVVYFFGAKLRAKSRYGGMEMMNTVQMQSMSMNKDSKDGWHDDETIKSAA